MGQNFIACDREQPFLLPPDVREWLPEDHLAWFVVDAVGVMDLAAFYATATPWSSSTGRLCTAERPCTRRGAFHFVTGPAGRGIDPSAGREREREARRLPPRN
jgi:hypothetical protein